jgi:hypothetical protein
LISRGGNDLTASPDMRASSDPHTDVGPDNATTVQHRGEGNKRSKSE